MTEADRWAKLLGADFLDAKVAHVLGVHRTTVYRSRMSGRWDHWTVEILAAIEKHGRRMEPWWSRVLEAREFKRKDRAA